MPEGNSGIILRNPPRKLIAPDGSVILDLTGASSTAAPTWGGGASKLQHAQKISAYPLVIGTDVPHDTAAGVGAVNKSGDTGIGALTLSGLFTPSGGVARTGSGRPNLLPNSTFALGTAFWGGVGSSYWVLAEDVTYGTVLQKTASSGTSVTSVYSVQIPASAGLEYTVSGMIDTSGATFSGGATFQLDMQFHDASGSFLGEAIAPIGTSAPWTLIQATATAPTNTASIVLYLRNWPNSGSITYTSPIKAARLKVEQGSTATAWDDSQLLATQLSPNVLIPGLNADKLQGHYPLVIGTDVPHDSAAGVGAVANAGSAVSIQSGTAASRPAAGTAGRFYWATDTYRLSFDNGTSWLDLDAKTLQGHTPGTGANQVLLLDSSGNFNTGKTGRLSNLITDAGSANGGTIHQSLYGNSYNTATVGLTGAMSGSNAGGNYAVFLYDDSGAFLVTALELNRSTNGGAIFGGAIQQINAQSTSGPLGVPAIIARKINEELTSTSATQIFSVTPNQNGQFRLNFDVGIVTAATTISATLTWTNERGSQSYPILSSQSLALGDHGLPVYVFEATTGGAITLSVTAGTANQAYVTATAEAM